jgi:hypothetical protein
MTREADLVCAVLTQAYHDALDDACEGAINSHNCKYFLTPDKSLLWWLDLLSNIDAESYISACNKKIIQAWRTGGATKHYTRLVRDRKN